MNKNFNAKETKSTLDKYVKNICSQLESLDHRYIILQGDLGEMENKIIEAIIDNSKKILKNVNHHNIWETAYANEFQHAINTLIMDCEIACIFNRVQDFKEDQTISTHA